MQNMNIRKSQGGFTLIELVIVIVILGILAAVAIPRYVDLTAEAESATCDGIKGALSSTGAILIASSTAGGVGTPGDMTDIGSGTVQDGWSVDSFDPSACSFDIDVDDDGSVECTVSIDSSLADDC